MYNLPQFSSQNSARIRSVYHLSFIRLHHICFIMATQTTHEEMKGERGATLQHVETNDTDRTPQEEKNVLEHQHTLSSIDVENKAAYKGDDSDGSVDWTVRNILASIFLCMLYTGS